MSRDRIFLARLFVQPFAQAFMASTSVLATTGFLYAQTAIVVFTLNMLWWSNTKLNRHTDHIRFAGMVYAAGFTSGHLAGMFVFQAMRG